MCANARTESGLRMCARVRVCGTHLRVGCPLPRLRLCLLVCVPAHACMFVLVLVCVSVSVCARAYVHV